MNLFTILNLNFVVVLFIVSVSKTESSGIRCMEKERKALVNFKEGLKDEFGFLSSWLTTDDCCEWRGVGCSNRTNRVVSLRLPSTDVKSLGGTLRPSLLELEYLAYLDLSFFDSDALIIPEFIGSFTRLKYLNLSSAAFCGEIPEKIFSRNFSNLQYLDLSSKHFCLSAKTINWLSFLPSLRYLDLSGADLSKAYDWTQAISRLPFLTQLRLSLCSLTRITMKTFPSFNFSKSLSVIDLSFNDFGIELSRFQWILNHSSTLTSIELGYSQLFGGIPEYFGKMQSLEYLDMHYNMLGGDIPLSIGNLSSLWFLDLSSIQLNGTFPTTLLKLPKLETLLLGMNQIQGALPMFFPSSRLIKLDLKLNKFTGSLPPSIGNLTELKYLDLSSNGFTGLVTELHLNNLSKLDFLSLSHNSLILELNSNWIPSFNLTQLYLVNCKMGPRFPMWLRSQTNLEVIEVSGCEIDDEIPNWFQHNFHRLYSLSLSKNQIRGTLPHFSTKLFRGFKLDLSYNKFRDPIISVCNLTNELSYLDVSNNLLTGTIPNCLMQFTNLWFLNLGHNNLSGKIPNFLMKFRNLLVLNLGNNYLSGKIPNLIGQLTRISELNLGNNSLEGELPTSLQLCTELRTIDIGNNKIKGDIPRYFGISMPNLLILNLRSNQFKGEIPTNICDLKRLRVLDLSYNRICGIIPKCFGNLTSMAEMEDVKGMAWDSSNPTLLTWKGLELEFAYNLIFVKSIDLSSNNLSGEIPSEITNLQGLIALNISRNNLHGKIPFQIGRLQRMEFLDMSRNRLDGTIPLSLSQLTFLSSLDLSTNNLSGRIPASTQLQSFGAAAYSNNSGLCGLPLPNLCPGDQRNSSGPKSNGEPQEEEEEERFSSFDFLAAMGIGFAGGLLASLGSLLVNKTWRLSYFRWVSNIQDSLYVSIAVRIAKWKRIWNK